MSNFQPKPEKYIDPLNDWGFRYYFGEPNKEILMAFLNDLFEGEKRIISLEFGPTEHDGDEGEILYCLIYYSYMIWQAIDPQQIDLNFLFNQLN
ncbi:PD-(D/E)XK nuclease family transposase [Olivibacter sp. XZL3]|uniref:PD-(D/E)XK nuclease family transposase n=1 Tax=Olivibacter sp. XZL3 TaxID=1735116 RepID=UPI001064B977|nr:PD-(D/E)XK nuclease family transposase [Olivibacter sp. XZL3]